MKGQNGNKSSNSKPKNRGYRNGKKNGKRSSKAKEMEINVKDSEVNLSDLKGQHVSKENDFEWYNHYPELVRDAATFNFSDPVGTFVNTIDFKGSSVTAANMFTVPGIMAIDYSPTLGLASGLTVDFVNVALNRLYVFMRRNLSSTAPYDAADLGYYLESMDSIYQLYQSAVRAYGLVQNAKVYNRYIPRALVEAMGFDFDWMMDNLAVFRSRLNYIAHTLAQFCVPSGFDFINRHIWMVSDVFYDAESVKSQMYFYRLAGYYKFVEATGSSTPAYLSYNPITYKTNALLTGDEFLDILNGCVTAIMNSQDMITISGDLLKGFGENNLFAVQPIGEDYIIEPIYSREVLSQIENATLMGYFKSDAKITQNTSLAGGPNLQQTITCDKITDTSTAAIYDAIGSSNYMLNTHMSDVSPADVMVATRLMVPFTVDAGNVTPWAFGTEIAHSATIYAYGEHSIPGSSTVSKVLDYKYIMQYSSISSYVLLAQAWSIFDWAPMSMLITESAAVGLLPEVARLCDIDNYAILSDDNLNSLHRIAVTSEYDLPQLSALSKSPVNR